MAFKSNSSDSFGRIVNSSGGVATEIERGSSRSRACSSRTEMLSVIRLRLRTRQGLSRSRIRSPTFAAIGLCNLSRLNLVLATRNSFQLSGHRESTTNDADGRTDSQPPLPIERKSVYVPRHYTPAGSSATAASPSSWRCPFHVVTAERGLIRLIISCLGGLVDPQRDHTPGGLDGGIPIATLKMSC